MGKDKKRNSCLIGKSKGSEKNCDDCREMKILYTPVELIKATHQLMYNIQKREKETLSKA